MTLPTRIGVLAIVLWSALALLTAIAGAIPPFELMALSFGVAFAAALARAAVSPRASLLRLRQPIGAWALSFFGLFLYHALYFFALQAAAPAEASLIAYLWPLLTVLLSASAPDAGLRAGHVIGAMLGLAGTAVLVLDPAQSVAGGDRLLGDAAAAGCAVIWAGYSVLNRHYADVPVDVVATACGPVALLGLACHLVTEPSVTPSLVGWAAILCLGIGPVGLAFIAWDFATKHGSLPTLGALSYLAPLASTILMVLGGRAQPRPLLFAAAGLMVVGAVLAAAARPRYEPGSAESCAAGGRAGARPGALWRKSRSARS